MVEAGSVALVALSASKKISSLDSSLAESFPSFRSSLVEPFLLFCSLSLRSSSFSLVDLDLCIKCAGGRRVVLGLGESLSGWHFMVEYRGGNSTDVVTW